MATDYDAPRGNVTDVDSDSIEELKARRTTATAYVDIDEDSVDGFELPGVANGRERCGDHRWDGRRRARRLRCVATELPQRSYHERSTYDLQRCHPVRPALRRHRHR